ncbi:unnamed protein product [Malus baccata var. baccata]
MDDHPFADSLSVARWLTEFVLIASTLAALPLVSGTTDASDVQALQVLYTSVNNPSQLTGWKSSGDGRRERATERERDEVERR